MASQYITEFAQKECAAKIAMATKQDGTLHFNIDQIKINTEAKGDLYSNVGTDKRIDSREESNVYSRLNYNNELW